MRKLAGITIVALCLIGTANAMASNQPQECPSTGPTGITLVGTHQGEKLVGCPEIDSISGLGGDDRIWGGLDPDALSGGPGRDVIHAVDANVNNTDVWEDDRGDTIDGGPGHDTCFVSDSDVVIRCEVVMSG